MAGNQDTTRILLGHVSGAHGIKGEVVIHSYTAAAEDIAAYGPLSDESGTRHFELKSARATGKGVVARIIGVNDRNAAEALKGTALYVDRAKLPAPATGAFYHSDLIGLAAVDVGGAALGEVIAVHNFGAGDLIEIRMPGRKDTALVPFTDAFVPEVDLAAGRVVIAPVPGLLD